MQRKMIIFIGLFLSNGAAATVCPTGTIAVNRNAAINLAPTCSYQTIGIASSKDFPELACTSGTTEVKNKYGTIVSVYKDQYTKPALHIKQNDTECFINMVAGTADNTIHVKQGDITYSASELKLCLSMNPDANTTQMYPSANTTNWSGITDTTTVTGISHCGATGTNIGDVTSAVSLSSTATENLYCWCRMTSPVISHWVFSMQFASATNCDTYCVSSCAENFAGNKTFRTALINSINIIN